MATLFSRYSLGAALVGNTLWLATLFVATLLAQLAAVLCFFALQLSTLLVDAAVGCRRRLLVAMLGSLVAMLGLIVDTPRLYLEAGLFLPRSASDGLECLPTLRSVSTNWFRDALAFLLALSPLLCLQLLTLLVNAALLRCQ